MKRKLLSSALWLVMAGCVLIAPAFVPPVVHADGAAAVTTYYSDSTHTTVVGRRVVTCNGQIIQTGTVTQFETIRILECAPQ